MHSHPQKIKVSAGAILLAAMLLAVPQNARATVFSNPFAPICSGILSFDWKIFSGSTFTGWVVPDEVWVESEISIEDESCGCPGEGYVGCWGRADASSAQWQIW